MKWLVENLPLILGTLGAVLAFFGVKKAAVRRWVLDLFSNDRANRSQRIEDDLKALIGSVGEIDGAIKILTERDNLRFRFYRFPAFECSQDGKKLRVSDAYLELLGLVRCDSVASIECSQFVHSDDLDGYLRAFAHAVELKTDFGYSIRMVNADREPIGKWYVKCKRMTDTVYFGKFLADDATARRIHEQQGWDEPR